MKEEMRKNKGLVVSLEDENSNLKQKLDKQISEIAELHDKERKIMTALKVKNMELQSVRDDQSVAGSKRPSHRPKERDDDNRSRAHTSKSHVRPTSILKNNDKKSEKNTDKGQKSVLQSFKNLMKPTESTKKEKFDDGRESSRRKRKRSPNY